MIEDSIARGYEKTLVYYTWMKAKKHRPVYNSFSCRGLAKEIGVSVTTISKHIPIMEKFGLIRFENGNLICTGTNSWLKSRRLGAASLVPVKLNTKNKSVQLNYIRYVVIHRNLSYQAKAIERKQAILNLSREDVNLGQAETKFLLKQRPKYEARLPSNISLEQSLRKGLMMSNTKFGKLIGLNKQGGQKFQKQLRDLKMIRSKSVFVQAGLAGLTPKMLSSYDLPTCYRVSGEGSLVRQKANGISLLNSRYPKMDSN